MSMSAMAILKVKAILLVAMLAGAHAQQAVALASASSVFAAGTDEANLMAQQMESMLADPVMQDQVDAFATNMEALMENPMLHEQAKIVAERFEALSKDLGEQMEPGDAARQIEEMMADPKLQEEAKHIAEPMKVVLAAMASNPDLQEHAQNVRELMAGDSVNEVYDNQEQFNGLFERALRGSSNNQADLDKTTMGKSSHIATFGQTNSLASKTPVQAMASKTPVTVMFFGGGPSTKTLPKAKPKVAPKKVAPKKVFNTGSKKSLQPLAQGTGYGSWVKDDRVGAFPPFGYWDPLGLSANLGEGQKAYLREAELKHGRICMLASLGFVVAERFHPFFGQWDGPALLAPTSEGTTLFWPAFLAVTGGLEVVTGLGRAEGTDDLGLAPALKADLTPGDIGWDPLGFKGRLQGDDWKNMQDRELAHARLGMIATLGLILQELITQEKSFGA